MVTELNVSPLLMGFELLCAVVSSTSLILYIWVCNFFVAIMLKIMVFQIKGDLFCRFLLYVRRRGKLSVSRIDGPLSLFLLQTAEKMMLIWELFSAAPESQATRRWNNLISSIGARHSGFQNLEFSTATQSTHRYSVDYFVSAFV